MSLISSSFSALSCAFTGIFSTGNSTKNSEERGCKVGSSVKSPLWWLAAFGLLASNAGSANAFANSNSTVDPDSIVNMESPIQPELSITRTPGEVKCEARFRKTIKDMLDCPYSEILIKSLEKENSNFVCFQDLGAFSVFDPESSTFVVSADERYAKLPQIEYVQHLLKDFTDWMFIEDLTKLKKKMCKASHLEYASSKSSILEKSDKLFYEILNGCVGNKHWPEEFLPYSSSARELVTEYISKGRFDEILNALKKDLKEDEIKEFENVSREEVIELAVKYTVILFREVYDDLSPVARIENSIKEWEKNCKA